MASLYLRNSSSQLPPEGEVQGWTVGDRGNQPSLGYLVYQGKWNVKKVRILVFPEVIAPITGEAPHGTATILARAAVGRPCQPRDLKPFQVAPPSPPRPPAPSATGTSNGRQARLGLGRAARGRGGQGRGREGSTAARMNEPEQPRVVDAALVTSPNNPRRSLTFSARWTSRLPDRCHRQPQRTAERRLSPMHTRRGWACHRTKIV
jgi:hypothetical protein